MTRDEGKGLWLRPKVDDGKKDTGWIPGTVAAMLAFGCMILGFGDLTGFSELYGCVVLLVTGWAVCVAHGISTVLGKRSWFAPVVLVLLLALVLLGRQYLLEGIRLFWNQLGDTWTAGTGRVLPALQTQLEAQERPTALMLFSVAAGGISALVCCLLVSSRAAVLAVVLPGAMLWAMVWFGEDSSVRYLTLLLFLAVMLLAYSGWEKKKTAWPALASWAVWAALGAVAVLGTSVAAEWAAEVSGQLHDAVHTYRYETGDTTLPEGDLRRLPVGAATEKPALLVDMETPEAMYLRGYTGAGFDDDVWSPLDTQILAENEDLLYGLELEAFDPSAQFSAAASVAGYQTNVVTIQDLGACSAYLYVPFSLENGSWIPVGDLNEAVAGDGQRAYSYTTVSAGAQQIQKVQALIQASEEPEALGYRKAETAYRNFVYEHYMQIPEAVEQSLGKEWDEIAAGYGGMEVLSGEQAQACVLAFLDRRAEDNSYQAATIAVLTLRYFGIPARYAEGYVITSEMAAAGGTIQVDSRHAAAWAEVYVDGIGWLPMALTPGLEQTAGGQEGSSGGAAGGQENGAPSFNGTIQLPEQPQPELPETELPKEAEPAVNDSSMLELLETLLWIGLVLAAFLLLLVVLLAIRRMLFTKRRERKFQGEDRSEAVAWIFADTVLLLNGLGLDRGNGSMTALFEPAARRLGPAYGDRLREMTDLNARAMFSSHQLEEVQREELLGFRQETLRLLKAGTKWKKRLWMKWIQCLY
ncbi:MAG: transglutaminase domain-containing protein [Oscillospiraceae bacterium]|nr:transglutaminase domain-containing protein [Oscillospiraceae bacterium]